MEKREHSSIQKIPTIVTTQISQMGNVDRRMDACMVCGSISALT
jgi:hypothetical protein